MPSGEAIIVAASALAVFTYHTTGAFVLIGGADPLPVWLRRILLPRRPANGVLRVASIIWVVTASIISQLVVIWALAGRGRDPTPPDNFVLAGELGLALAWLVYVAGRWRSFGE